MIRLLFLLLFLFTLPASGQQLSEIPFHKGQFSLNGYSYHLDDLEGQYGIDDVIDADWQKLEGAATFPNNLSIHWVRYEIDNDTDDLFVGYYFIPYHHIHALDIYLVSGDSVIQTFETGTTRSFYSKPMLSIGYPIPIQVPANHSLKIYVRADHVYRPLRVSSFLMTDARMNEFTVSNLQIVWFWRGVFVITSLISLILFFFIRLRLFLYYFLFNVGLSLFIGAHIGDIFLFIDRDTTGLGTMLDYTGALIINIMLPVFLNALTPVKQRNPWLWKFLSVMIIGIILLWIINLFPGTRFSMVTYYTHFYIMIGSMITFLLQPVMLIRCVRQGDENARPLIFIYSLFIFSAFIDVILPNMGLMQDSPSVYQSVFMGSFIEMFSFMFIMGRKTLQIYQDRAELLQRQKNHQKEMMLSIVNSQEDERNRVGRELHDMIGANLAMIKHNLDPKDEALQKTLTDSIESVRHLSHGLMTPRMKENELIDEIKQLTQLANNEQLDAQVLVYQFPKVQSEELATHIYRICQELIQNGLKHSQASSLYLQLVGFKDNTFSLIYEDNGVGFDYQSVGKKGKGLNNIAQRVELIHGTLEVDSSNNGTTILIDAKTSLVLP